MVVNILEATGTYSSQDILLFEKEVKRREIQKNEILLEQGETCKSIFFNLKGAFYQYNFNHEMEQNIIDLHIENEWFLNQTSFISQKPSETFIAAYSTSHILELTVSSLHHLIAQSPSFFQLGKIMEPSNSRVYFFDHLLTPIQKYQYILEHREQLIQAFPLKIIASYLKITPETLSRVREKLSNHKIVS